jgi:hypothetical protein
MKQHDRKNCDVILKQNRGRDVSSLLVACKEYVFKYEYLCFIHDKKSTWLDEGVDLGLLVPPEPIGKQLSACKYWGL